MKKTNKVVNTTKVANDIKATLNIKTLKKTKVGKIEITPIEINDDNVIQKLRQSVKDNAKDKALQLGFEKYLAEKCNTEKGKQFIADTCNHLAYE